MSLCQFMLLLVGSWIAVRFDQLWPWLPYPAVLLIAGIVTGLIGTLIGLPALRLSGLYLALITLMAAAAITVLLKVQQFPNGGGGFWGVKKRQPHLAISRPSIALGDTAFYRYCVCVAIVMFLIAFWHVKTKPGRAWAAIRQSEATALSAGVRTTVYKLWAFALAAFFAGVAGGMLASPPRREHQPVQDTGLDRDLARSLSSEACTRWRGRSSVASCSGLCPRSSSSGTSASSWSTILSGVGILQVLLTAPGGIAAAGAARLRQPRQEAHRRSHREEQAEGSGRVPGPAAVPGVEAAEPSA